ncbi:MAG: hypothetical protein MI861_15930 [Pirellulales bacterium]|nr:hypothetical protein [Pirellulales bacterium]
MTCNEAVVTPKQRGGRYAIITQQLQSSPSAVKQRLSLAGFARRSSSYQR